MRRDGKSDSNTSMMLTEEPHRSLTKLEPHAQPVLFDIPMDIYSWSSWEEARQAYDFPGKSLKGSGTFLRP